MPDADAYHGIVLLFDDDAVAAARAPWGEAKAKAKGFDATYWQADEHGRWTKKA